MELDMELEPRVKPRPYKVKAMSRESATQKAANILDTDLRTHWSTGTNTKEWILLELEEPCLLSHIRIYNKSVLEWEISVSLRYKPEAFTKVRPRCEAPRRDMVYPMNYAPCRYVRISCLRGNPIGIFFVQLIGISVKGLEAEFQPFVNHLLTHIVARKQEADDIYLQLLQDATSRLSPFLPQLEGDLGNFSESPESCTEFFAMLVGPFYPILYLIHDKDDTRALGTASESDVLKQNQPAALMISSNFEAQVRRSRGSSAYSQSISSSVAFRPDIVFMLLRKAFKDSELGSVCRAVCQAIMRLSYPVYTEETSISADDTSAISDHSFKDELPSSQFHISDYSSLFGNDFKMLDYSWDGSLLHVLNAGSVEEGMLHVLYACVSEPFLCRKLAENNVELWFALPLVQAMLPALRPSCSHLDQFDETFSQWNQPLVQRALSQIVAALTSTLHRPLLHACAGYLSSFSQSNVKAACLLIDLCFGPLAPWLSTLIAKIDLAIELLEDLVSTIQDSHRSASRARAALKYLLLALSGHMDDILSKYKVAKHRLLFLIEILEPFLDPALTSFKNAIAFGNVPSTSLEKQERDCALSLKVIQTAVHRQAVLSALESEWRRGNVMPSVLISILGPHLDLPSDIDLSKHSDSKNESLPLPVQSASLAVHEGGVGKSYSNGEFNAKVDTSEAPSKMDANEDAHLLFAPVELKTNILRNLGKIADGGFLEKNSSGSHLSCLMLENKHLSKRILSDQFKDGLVLDVGLPVEFFNLQADYLQLVNHQICELKASEFQRLAYELHRQPDLTPEGHDAAIDSLLLAAECYVNPFFLMSFAEASKPCSLSNEKTKTAFSHADGGNTSAVIAKRVKEGTRPMDIVADLERRRDKIVLQIVLHAASIDKEFCLSGISNGMNRLYEIQESTVGIDISSLDEPHMDAVTLVRKNQALLCHFVIQHLQRDQYPMHEILLQCLLFILHSATELACSTADVVDIILHSAEQLNELLASLYCQLKEGSLQLNPEKVHQVQRRWILLQSLVVACCGADGLSYLTFKVDGFQYRNLVPPSAWIERIPKFSNSQFPLVRFLGWMAVASYAKKFFKERMYLVSDLSEMTCLLSIFTDELAMVDEEHLKTMDSFGLEHLKIKEHVQESNAFGSHPKQSSEKSFHVIYPYLQQFFPNMKLQFETFGELILEAVGLQLKYLPHKDIPDALCWFCDLCLWPSHSNADNTLATEIKSDHVKGSAVKNARVIILYVLQIIVTEHMQSMVPEIPMVMQVLKSICRNSYFDVAFIDSVLRLLEPLVSFALRKARDDENLQNDESSCENFESLCFKELFINITINHEEIESERTFTGALTVFTLGALFPSISFLTRKEAFKYLLMWADFVSFEQTSSFYSYLCAFQKLMDNCLEILTEMLEKFGITLPRSISRSPVQETVDNPADKLSSILDDLYRSLLPEITEELEQPEPAVHHSNQNIQNLQGDEIITFCTELQKLALKLCPNVDQCWKLHPQLAKKLVIASSNCYIYSKCLFSVHQSVNWAEIKNNFIALAISDDIWKSVLGDLAVSIMGLVQSCRWQVASVMLDYLLLVPCSIPVECVIPYICSVINYICCHAPRISWRSQTDKWLLLLCVRDTSKIEGNSTSLVELFSAMLNHAEPEQRSIAIQHLGRIVRQGSSEPLKFFPPQRKTVTVDYSISFPRSFLSLLISGTFDAVAAISSSDTSPLLRVHASMLLLDFIPFAHQNQLHSLLCSCDKILYGLDQVNRPMREGLLAWLSLALIGNACLYSPLEDIVLIPQSVWVILEELGNEKNEKKVGKLEKACRALCNLKNQGDIAREVLREALSSTSVMEDRDPEFEKTRESIFQVVATLTSAESYFEFFSKNKDLESREIEEAEMEFELICSDTRPYLSSEEPCANLKEDNRLEAIKENIRSLEKAKIREEVAVRRQKKLHESYIRKKYLEEAALKEANLLMELDRERTTETEREIERQRLLELERAKTRELRHNLEMEKERQLQKELQREFEQPETGLRSSQRREFPSTTAGRPRDRYREREGGRGGADGSLRSSSRDRESGQPQGNQLTTATTVGGSRTFAGQTPTILQSRERIEEQSNSGGYEDIFDGGRDQGDTGSMGDPELSSAFDSSPGNFALAQKQGSRTGKSRQILERRDKDSRREGKWERKQP